VRLLFANVASSVQETPCTVSRPLLDSLLASFSFACDSTNRQTDEQTDEQTDRQLRVRDERLNWRRDERAQCGRSLETSVSAASTDFWPLLLRLPKSLGPSVYSLSCIREPNGPPEEKTLTARRPQTDLHATHSLPHRQSAAAEDKDPQFWAQFQPPEVSQPATSQIGLGADLH